MTPQEILEKLKARFGDIMIETKPEGVANPFAKVAPASIADVAQFLRDEPEFRFDYLMCLSGADLGKGMLGVVYHLASIAKNHKITLKVQVPADAPDVASVAAVWGTAEWHEREAYDMYGIKFTGHPDLRRLLLPEDWEGHPLRKDYKVPEFYQGMKVPY